MFETLLTDPKERAMHAGTVHALAQETGIPDEWVEVVYRGELVRLMKTARIRDFLPVLTGRVVKDQLRAAGEIRARPQ
jgi:hypothetical protein